MGTTCLTDRLGFWQWFWFKCLTINGVLWRSVWLLKYIFQASGLRSYAAYCASCNLDQMRCCAWLDIFVGSMWKNEATPCGKNVLEILNWLFKIRKLVLLGFEEKKKRRFFSPATKSLKQHNSSLQAVRFVKLLKNSNVWTISRKHVFSLLL